MFYSINGIREICVRQPLAMNETLLQDLTQYKNHRDKGIMMAARSLITLYREVNPEMLLRKDRGRSATMRLKDGTAKELTFGAQDAGLVDGLQGVELLDKEEAEDEGWDGWEVDSDDSDSDEEGWINVSSDEEDINIAMSDEEDDNKKKEPDNKEENGPRKRRIGKRQLRKLQDSEELSEEQQKKLAEEAAARRAEEEKKQAAIMEVASTRILTPADFARLNDMREKKEIEAAAGMKRSATDDGRVDESIILGPRKKTKADYEARMASIQEGREGREKFGSKKGNKDRGSTTNREKARNKNFMMIAHKHAVVSKSKRSLVDKQKAMRAAINKQKKMKR